MTSISNTSVVSYRDPLQNETSLYSIGTSFAIDGLEKFLMSGVRNTELPQVIAISVTTLMRNWLGSLQNVSLDYVATKCSSELMVLCEDVAHMVSAVNIHDPVIILYITNPYAAIKKDLIRPAIDSKSRKLLFDMTRYGMAFRSKIFGLVSENISGVPILIDTNHRSSKLPHQHLVDIISNVSSRKSIMMLSHAALDYHVYDRMAQFKLLDSHTGNIRSIEHVGIKVFKKDYIPFNKYTHALLGDKDYIQSPLKNKERTMIYDMAKSNRWETKSLVSIKKDIDTLGIPIPIRFD